ncbi:MAG: acetyl-CoA carboxylase biotin carboxyl carrier protein subunit [Calditerrivibrio sp.]|nr:acetyl-CoA carboxylase biotin carboxyl carrier protein subunit [Calditerrivibrio sp.]MCA1933113.1 acetyl-CoA carboxylase biotin carboxyl carrier protein subunit [Calditerrivibrio sp.]MCA1980027.1 acetyl-CoA carboxylase biotin carboxyl carrier protein subunit [Calditerrivibrio sp.]
MAVKRTYYATVDGHDGENIVNLTENAHANYTVNVNGKDYQVDFEQINDTIFSVIIDGKSYAVDMTEKGDKFDVIVNGDHFNVEVLDEMKRLMKMRTSTTVEGRQVIEAQMPGYIWKILKDVGDEVKAGEPIMILVAMKMENEIKSPKDGILQELFVKASENPQESTVAIGDKLAVVE